MADSADLDLFFDFEPFELRPLPAFFSSSDRQADSSYNLCNDTQDDVSSSAEVPDDHETGRYPSNDATASMISATYVQARNSPARSIRRQLWVIEDALDEDTIKRTCKAPTICSVAGSLVRPRSSCSSRSRDRQDRKKLRAFTICNSVEAAKGSSKLSSSSSTTNLLARFHMDVDSTSITDKESTNWYARNLFENHLGDKISCWLATTERSGEVLSETTAIEVPPLLPSRLAVIPSAEIPFDKWSSYIQLHGFESCDIERLTSAKVKPPQPVQWMIEDNRTVPATLAQPIVPGVHGDWSPFLEPTGDTGCTSGRHSLDHISPMESKFTASTDSRHSIFSRYTSNSSLASMTTRTNSMLRNAGVGSHSSSDLASMKVPPAGEGISDSSSICSKFSMDQWADRPRQGRRRRCAVPAIQCEAQDEANDEKKELYQCTRCVVVKRFGSFHAWRRHETTTHFTTTIWICRPPSEPFAQWDPLHTSLAREPYFLEKKFKMCWDRSLADRSFNRFDSMFQHLRGYHALEKKDATPIAHELREELSTDIIQSFDITC